jgi:3-hydroxybutyrate dehydrogenase
MSKGMNAVVTGSSSGIGLGIAREFASRGMNVMMHGIEEATKVETERAKLESIAGTKVIYMRADMTKAVEIRDLLGSATDEFGHVDVLVNNAGIQFVSPIDEFPEDRWDAVIALNLTAAFHAVKAVLPGMKSRGFGRIVNIASVHGLVASAYKSAYVAAKHGIVGMTKSAALEVAEQGVTVNAVCPGYVWTTIMKNQVADISRKRGMSEEEVVDEILKEKHPNRKFVSVEQVASLVYYLCTEEAGAITGAALPVDGGWTVG